MRCKIWRIYFLIVDKQMIHLKWSHFWGFSFGDAAIFQKLGRNFVFVTFTFLIEKTLLFRMPQAKDSIWHSISVLWREMRTHFITMTSKSCKNFKAIFLKTLFFKSSTSNAYISESFAFRRFGQVSIDPKFYLVLRSGHNSIPQKWDLFRWMYTNVK